MWRYDHRRTLPRFDISGGLFCDINYSYVLLCVSFLSHPVAVAVSKAKILGNQELYIKSGNDINLTCTTSQVSSPSFIYWYKGGRVVNYSQRGGINVSTDRTTKTSNLIISRASPADSGNYTCAPSNSGKLIKLIARPIASPSVGVLSHPAVILNFLSSAIRCRLRHGARNWWQHRCRRHEAWQQQRNEPRLFVIPLQLLPQLVVICMEMSYHINVNK